MKTTVPSLCGQDHIASTAAGQALPGQRPGNAGNTWLQLSKVAPSQPGLVIDSSTNPATIYAGTVVSGAPATSALPVVTVGGMPVPVISSILTAGSVGLYQVTIQLPANVPTGAAAIQASAGGVSTPAGVTILVENP